MCRIDYADDYDWTCLVDKHPKARKPHQCGDCGRTIEAGESYHYAKAVTEYGFDIVKQCAHCEAASHWLTVVCRGYLYNGVCEEIREHWDEEWVFRCLDLGRLCVASQRRWRGMSVESVAVWARSAAIFAKAKIDKVSV